MIDTCVYATQSWSLVRIYDEQQQVFRLAKVQTQDGMKVYDAVMQEIQVFTQVKSQWLLQPIACEMVDGKYGILYEDFQGISLVEWLEQEHSLLEVIDVALTLVNAFLSFEQQQFIFNSVNPQYILIHPVSRELKFISSAYSFQLQHESVDQARQYQMPWDYYPYIAPEQTGKISAKENFSTDLYGFGAILYELLAKKPLYRETDPQLLQYHILTTNPLLTTAYFIPPTLQDIVYKLLKKRQAERYQSVIALRADLLKIKAQVETGQFESFEIATNDVNLQLGLAYEVYGQEKAHLFLIEHLYAHGKKILAIYGESGSGKSTLLHHFQEQLMKEQYVVVYIDFEQLHMVNDEDYAVWPLRQIMRQLYTMKSSKVNDWVAALKKRDVIYGSQMEQVLPELKWFTSEEGVTQSLQQTVHALYEALHELNWRVVLLFDHVDYLDRKQQMNVKAYIDGCSMQNSLFVLCFEAATAQQTVDQTWAIQGDFVLKPLTLKQVEQWLIDSYGIHIKGMNQLADYLHRIAKGNPYYIREFFKAIVSQKILYFDFLQNQWVVEKNKLIESEQFEVLDLHILRSWQGLSADIKELVAHASYLGMQFDCIWLCENVEHDLPIIKQAMEQLTNHKIISASTDTTYQFHSQMVYETIKNTVLKGDVPRICRTLLQRLVHAKLVDAVSWTTHFLHVSEHLKEAHEDVVFSKAVLMLQKLLEQNKLRAALMLVNRLLQWSHYYCEWKNYTLYCYLATIQHKQYQLKEAIHTTNQAFLYAKTRAQKVNLYRMRVAVYLSQNNIQQALLQAEAAFALFQQRLYQSPIMLRFLDWRLTNQLKHHNNEALRRLPVNRDDSVGELITLLHLLIEHRLYDETIFKSSLFLAVKLSITDGSIAEKAKSFMYFAIYLVKNKNFSLAQRLAALSLELAKSTGDEALEAYLMSLNGQYMMWQHSYNETNDYLVRAGLIHASQVKNNQLQIVVNLFVKGVPIKDLLEEMKEIQYAPINELSRWLELLEGKSFFSIGDIVKEPLNDASFVLRLKMAYLFNLEEVANELLDRDYQKGILSAMQHYEHQYRALWLLYRLRMKNIDMKTKKRYIKNIQEILAELKYWTTIAPTRYEHTYTLVMAEWLGYQGQYHEAKVQYHHAAMLAKTYGYQLDKAVIYYCMAHFYRTIHEEQSMKKVIQQAAKVLYDYGAITLLNSWESQFNESVTAFSMATKQSGQVRSIDIDAFLQMTKMVMQDLHVSDFIHNVLDTLAKYAGASHGLFLLESEGELKIKARSVNTTTTIFTAMRPIAILEQYQQYVIDYGVQLREVIIVDEQVRGYLKKQTDMPSYSILCLPILSKNKVRGAILLENQMLGSVFHHHQLGFFQAISTLISVSLENVELYEQLGEIVDQRTEQLRLANQDLQMKNSQLHAKEIERKQLFHNISHELRSPITSTIGFLDAILEGVVVNPQKQLSYLSRSKDRLMVLNRLIQDIFDLANLESGRLAFQLSHVKMADFVDFFSNRYQSEIQQKRLQYKFSAHDLPEATLLVDLVRIEQVVWNLISNAIKNTEAGTITLKFTADEQQLYCTVTDTGKGVKMEDQPFIFDSYYKAANVPKVSSTGIGLAICKQIIVQHKGKIMLKSDHEQGAAFTFSLPLHVNEQNNWRD